MYSGCRHVDDSAYGLIGYPLGHSHSKTLFEKKAKQTGRQLSYALCEWRDAATLADFFLLHPTMRGANVTHPHKRNILPHLQRLHPKAAQIGAVNLLCKESGDWVGYNTDYMACKNIFARLARYTRRGVLVLGTGGAARAVARALQALDVPYDYVSRDPASQRLNYEALKRDPASLARCGMVVQATPLGTHPRVADCPDIPYHALHGAQLAYDLVYNPTETLFLQKAKTQGCATKNGYEMLELQFQYGWDVWFGTAAS